MMQCMCFTCCKKRSDGHDLLSLAWLNNMAHMHVCEICGCKRCPHATNHELECTDSNEPGQPGSRYGGLS